MKSIIFAVGHTASGTAGCGVVGDLNESNCTREIAPLCDKYASEEGIKSTLLRVDKGNSYNCEDCFTRVNMANSIGADLYTEVHINSGGAGATGVEVLVNSLGNITQEYGERICANIAKAFGIPNRGVKQQNLIVLRRTSMPAILVECCFCNAPDAPKYNADLFARCIVGGILNRDISDSWKQGWNQKGGRWWYSPDPENKTYYKSEWKLIDGDWYLFDSNGWCTTGWVYYQTYSEKKDVWYYLEPGSCKMAKGWKQIDGDWYYFSDSGEMQTGWIKDDGKDYLLYSSGAMACNCELYGYKFDSHGVATKL